MKRSIWRIVRLWPGGFRLIGERWRHPKAVHAETQDRMDSYGTLATKLQRTFTTQIEALAKLRRGGEQKVRVEHVHVYPGGRPIVGNVTTAGGGVTLRTGVNLMHSLNRQPSPFRMAQRCCARTRRGTSCMSPAVKGKARCRMHEGAKGSGAPRGSQNGAYRNGLQTVEAVALRRECRELMQAARDTLGRL